MTSLLVVPFNSSTTHKVTLEGGKSALGIGFWWRLIFQA